MPLWFVRLVVGTIFGLFLQLCGAIWWAATITAKLDYSLAQSALSNQIQDREIARLDTDLRALQTEHDEDLKFTGDTIANLKADLKLILDRGRRPQGE